MKNLSPVKKNSAIFLFFAIFLFLVLIGLVSFAWHSLSIKNPILSLSLDEYDSGVWGRDACFNVVFEFENIEKKPADLFLKLNEKIILSEKIIVGETKNFAYCVPNALLTKGDNLIEINTYSRKLFFHVNKDFLFDESNSSSSNIEIIGVEKKNNSEAIVEFSLLNKIGEEKRADIFVNGSLVKHSFYPNGKNSEIIPVSEGKNVISLKFYEGTQDIEYFHEVGFVSNVFLGLFLVALFLFICISAVFNSKPFIENITYSILFLLVSFTVIFFVLNYSSLLSNVSFIGLFIFEIVILSFVFGKNFSIPKIVFPKPTYFTVFLALLIIVILLFNLITPTYVSFWTSFYERQSKSIFELNGIPLVDEFTHFGEKPYGYMSAYFFVNVGLSYLFGEPSQTVYALLLILSNIVLFFSAIIFFRKIGVDGEKSKIILMLMLLAGFFFGDIFFNVRHLMAVALMFVSLSFFTEKKIIKAGIIGGLAMAFQAPVILTAILVGVVLTKYKIKDFVKYVITSLIVAVIFYLPTFISVGLPTQARSTTWGYLFGMPWYGVLVDLLAQLIFFFIITLPIIGSKPNLDFFSKKILAAVIILLGVQLFISYRVNIATTTIFSFLGVYLFPSKLLERKEVRHFLFIIFVAGLLIASTVLLNYVVPDFALNSADYMKTNTPSDARVLNEPALGHYLSLFGEKKIMSDLAVEYANGEMIDKSFNFLETGDSSILSEYNIDYVFNRAMFIETQPVGSPSRDEAIEFYSLDKIYDDTVFFVHRVR